MSWIGRFLLALLAVVCCRNEVFAADLNRLELTALRFDKLQLAGALSFDTPHHIFKSRSGDLWLVYGDFVLKKSGSFSHKLLLPGDKSAYSSHDSAPVVRALDYGETVVFSYNRQLFYFAGHEKQLKHWLDFADPIAGLQVFGNGQLWVSTIKGIYRIDGIGQPAQVVEIPDEMMDAGLPTIAATYLHTSDDDTLWVGSFLSRIYKITIKESNALVFEQFKIGGEQNSIVHSIKAVNPNTLLLGTSSGLIEFDRQKARFSRISSSKPLKFAHDLNVTARGVWFKANDKLYFRPFTADVIREIRGIDDIGLGREDYRLNGVFGDDENNIWITVKNQGVHRYSIYSNRIKRLAGSLIGHDNLKMFKLDDETLVFSASDSTFLPLSDKTIPLSASTYYKHTDGRYYLAGNGKVTGFELDEKTTEIDIPAVAAEITSMLIDDFNRLWLSDKMTGLHIWDLNEQQFIDTEAIETKGIAQTLYLAKANSGRLHLAGRSAIKVIEPSLGNDKVVGQIKLPDEAARIEQQQQWLIIYHQDSAISRYDLATGHLQHLRFDGIDNIGCVYPLDESLWWLAQKHGALIKYDTTTTNYIRYSEKHGIPKGGLTGEWCGKHRGRYYFSSHGGFVRTSADLTVYNSVKPVSRILSIRNAHGELVEINPGNTVLKPSDFPISLAFFHSSHAMPSANQSRYRLKGLLGNWTDINSQRGQISFTSLKGGDYRLSIKGSNNDGVWGEPATVEFTVLPPPWLTWWAILGYCLTVVLLFFVAVGYRTRAVRKKALLLEQTVAKRTEELRQVLDKKHEEFANVSHEFRTPLTLVIGPVERLLQNETGESTKQALQMIKRNGYRLLRMVDQLLHMEKFRVEQIVSQSAVQARPIIKMIAESFQDLAKEKNITLTIEQLDDVWLMLTPNALETLLLNLLSNAVKYTPAGGVIKLSAKVLDANRIEIMVADSGIGIAKSQQSAIFNRFHRVLDSHSEQIAGAGIGLALVHELVNSHKGTIRLESEPGQGTVFTVELPRHKGHLGLPDKQVLTAANAEIVELEIDSLTEQQPAGQFVDTPMQQSEKGIHILVVEDNPDMRNYIASTLADEYHVSVANDGKQGFEMATEYIPDLIISDVMMPTMDGYTLCRLLKSQELTHHIPLVLLTARSDTDSRLKGWQNQADEYLTKPFDSKELLLRVENLLYIRQLLKQHFYQKIQSDSDNNSSVCQSKDTQQQTPDDDIAQWQAHEQRFIDKLILQVEEHIADPEFKVEQIAKGLAMSQRQLYRKLKGTLNVTPADFLRSYRLEKAIELMRQEVPVSNVAFEVGFSSHSYFCRCFRAKYDMSPSQYIEALAQ